MIYAWIALMIVAVIKMKYDLDKSTYKKNR